MLQPSPSSREPRRRPPKLPRLLGALVLAASLAWPTQARAHPNDISGLIAIGVLGGIAGGTVVIGGIVTGIHNGAAGARGVRPTNGWKYSGYTFGVINAVGGLAWVTGGLIAGIKDKSMLQLGLGAGIPLTIIGGGGLALTGWSSQMPEETAKQGRVMLVPSAIRDVSGRLAPGVGIAGVGF
jgi:hypothetical protein